MKKSVKLALVALLAVIALCALVACNVDGDISIEKMPQITYVLGQDLNLSAGILRVEGKNQSVAMNSPDVKVEGYDKNKLGEQELTLTYKNMSTTLTVTVVERFTVVRGVTLSYFVGEPFDGKGYFTLTTDNGQSISVAANASGLISSFDTSVAGTVTVPLSYQGYTGSYDISVYAIDNTKTTLYLPKVSYKSHEPLSVDNGYLEVKNSDGTVTKRVTLTTDMVTGYDPSQATIYNSTTATALSQTLTVKYLDFTTNFTVKIIYSDVTFMHDKYVIWEKCDENDPEAVNAAAEGLFEAMTKYFALSSADKRYVNSDELTTIVQVSAAFGSVAWFEEYEAISRVLKIDAYGQFTFIGSYEDTKEVYDTLTQPNCRLVMLSDMINNIFDNFADTDLGDGSSLKIGNALGGIVGLTNFDGMVAQMAYMFTLYDLIVELPANATVEQWKSDYSNKVQAVANAIVYNSFNTLEQRQMFAVAASWHMDGFYDKLYEYYLDDEDMLDRLSTRQLPGVLEELYVEIINAEYQLLSLAYAVDEALQGYIVDGTLFLMYFHNATQMLKQVEASDNELYKQLYGLMPFFKASVTELKVFGYQELLMSLTGNPATDEFFNAYVDMVVAYIDSIENDGNYLDSDEFGVQITELLEIFLNLTPIEQLGVINVLNPANTEVILEKCLDVTKHYSLFTLFLDSYYSEHLSNNGYAIFRYYMQALEYYANINGDEYAGTSQSFYQMFDEIARSSIYTTWYMDYGHGVEENHNCVSISDDERAMLETLYNKVKNYLRLYPNQNTVPEEFAEEDWKNFADLDGDMQALFAELKAELDQMMVWYNSTNVGLGYSLFVANFEYVEYLANQILSSGNQDAINAYYFRAAYRGPDKQYWTMEYAVDFCRCDYVYFLSEGKGIIYDAYQSAALQAFLRDATKLLKGGLCEFLGLTYEQMYGQENDELDTATVRAILTAFRNLTLDEKDLFLLHLDIDQALYYRGISFYFQGLNDLVGIFEGVDESAEIKDIATLVDYLQDIELAYLSCLSNPDADNIDEKLNDLAELLATVGETMATLADYNGNDDFQILVDMYNYYQQACDNMR